MGNFNYHFIRSVAMNGVVLSFSTVCLLMT